MSKSTTKIPVSLMNEASILFNGINAAWSAVQWATIPMPTWGHILVTGVSGALAAIGNRQSVTPNGKINAL